MAYPSRWMGQGSSSMTATITRSHNIGFFPQWSHFKNSVNGDIGSEWTKLLVCVLLVPWTPRCCDMCSHPFHGALKPASNT
ncbi:hypothetical protein TNCV_1319291 [Trichonephila clavipes]|nr:hypothetical protein TNCV_1319291 [Trichonephila clavipes]